MRTFTIWLPGQSISNAGVMSLSSYFVQDKFDLYYRLSKGESLAAEWPTSMKIALNDMDRKSAKKIGSCLKAGPKGRFVSEKLHTNLVRLIPPDQVEFLPIKVVDDGRKRQLPDESIVIVNPLQVLDCIDIEGSEVEWNDLAPDQLLSCNQLVIDASRVPAEVMIFRLKQWSKIIIMDVRLTMKLIYAGHLDLFLWDPDDTQFL